ncbi:DUF2797 domain-containing protein [Streptomyces coryli]|uniref:DUF2797 domain-containing protein n=1 Tax=Streptomyces coryli TaxID=1128680 RepID=UPI0030B8B029
MPGWRWFHPEHGDRAGGELRLGAAVSLAVPDGVVRECVGVVRAGRRLPCPDAAATPAAAVRDQCERCAALDRSQSVAADTVPDDPRTYAVYLAWFGTGLVKVGITAQERGPARLLEQAAVCFTFLGHGPLMSARRTEAVLGAALGIPERVRSPRKRAARAALPPSEERAAELRGRYEAALAVPGWQETLTPAPYELVDHAAHFGLEPRAPRPTARVTGLAAGAALTGTVLAVAGSDVYLATGAGELLLDAHLVAGWPLCRPEGDGLAPPPTEPMAAAGQEGVTPEALF